MTQNPPLKIAYLCDITPLDSNLYSGGNARMYNALRAEGADVTILNNGWHWAEPLRRLMHRLPESINLRARWRLHLVLSKIIARGVQAELKRGRYDALFCAYSFQSMAGVRKPYPMVTAFTSDATPTIYKQSEVGQSFGSFLSISRWFDPWVEAQERKIFKDIDLLFWPTEWLKSGADHLYDLTPVQSKRIPWGANIGEVAADPIGPAISRNAPVQLLFIGRDWFAKGGHIAFAVLKALHSKGIAAHLTVIGTQPPAEFMDAQMTIFPQLNKAVPAEMAQFEKCFRSAHFLINPSFESWGFAFCEASAYGVPSLCLRVGGVPVENGVNGHALPVGSEAHDFVDVIEGYLDQPETFTALRASARKTYETDLNWQTWAQRVLKEIAAAQRQA